jgi:hypothetical protein
VHPIARPSVDLAAGAAIDDHALDRVAAAHRAAPRRRCLERQRLAAAHLLVGGDQRDRADVDEPFVQRLAEKPNTTECVAPMRAQACIATTPSIDIGM